MRRLAVWFGGLVALVVCALAFVVQRPTWLFHWQEFRTGNEIVGCTRGGLLGIGLLRP